MSQALYRKWRPHLWDEVIGQEHVIQTLRNAVRAGRVGHAYLFAGPRGTGKTTCARLLAKAVNCLDPDPANRPCDHCEHCVAVNEGRFLDLIEIDAASNTSVEDVRDLRDKINFSPSQGAFKVYIIDEVHMLSTAAFNALLKTLEEPPAHAIFILATTESHRIPATVLSRVQRHEFRRIPVGEIVRNLRDRAAGEGLEIDEDALLLIARQSTGCMRDAISLLDQLTSTGEPVTLGGAQAVLGTATSVAVIELVDAFCEKNPAAGLERIHTALDSGVDARQFARQVVEYLRGLLLIKMGSGETVDAVSEVRAQMARHAAGMPMPNLLEAIRLFNAAAVDPRGSWHPGLMLELAFAQSLEGPAQPLVVQAQTAPAQQAAVPAYHPAQSSAPARESAHPTAPQRQPQAEKPAASAHPPAQQQSAAPQQTGENAPARTAAITQNEIQQNWNRIRQLVKKRNPLTEAVLNSCRFALRDNQLLLSFQSDIVRQKIDTPDNLELVRQAVYHATGADLVIRCAVGGGKGGGEMDVDSDSIVGAALNLGGEIVMKD